jgi:TonB family protein
MEYTQKSDRYAATVITVTFHGLLLLLFILYKIITPLPPYPEDGGGGLGVELSFGNSTDGMGLMNPESLPAAGEQGKPAPEENAPILTSETEENNYVPEPEKPKKAVKPKELKRETSGPVITKTIQPTVNERALYPQKSNKSGSEGNTGKPGNQGSESGDPYSRTYDGAGGGSGEGGNGNGSGGGSGGGNGSGSGQGNGGGVSYNLGGRGHTVLPKPAYTSQKSGKVVVEIAVDKQGNVLSAKAGARGTTVQDASLFDQAEKAARKAKFKANPDAAEKQVGTITYTFIRN